MNKNESHAPKVTCPACGHPVQNLRLHNMVDHPERMTAQDHATEASRDGWTGD